MIISLVMYYENNEFPTLVLTTMSETVSSPAAAWYARRTYCFCITQHPHTLKDDIIYDRNE